MFDIKTKVNYEGIAKWAQDQSPNEACGLLVIKRGRVVFLPCENKDPSPQDFFTISREAYLKADEEGEVVGVVHSHPKEPYYPSQEDVKAQKISGVPWLVLGIKGDNKYSISWLTSDEYSEELYGREFCWCVFDCFTFIRDWYQKEYGIVIPEVPYEKDFWKFGKELYLDNYEASGFVEIPMSDLKYGDIILMDLTDNGITSHAAIYLGDNKIAHHLNGRLSGRDVYGQTYQNRTTKTLRHKEHVKND